MTPRLARAIWEAQVATRADAVRGTVTAAKAAVRILEAHGYRIVGTSEIEAALAQCPDCAEPTHSPNGVGLLWVDGDKVDCPGCGLRLRASRRRRVCVSGCRRRRRGGHVSERVAIVGSRGWEAADAVWRRVFHLPESTIVVTGGAPGVDTWAERAARVRGLDVIVHRANWGKYGRGAGPIRNSKIVADCDRVIAFWDGESKGTADTIRKAKAAGKPVEVIRE